MGEVAITRPVDHEGERHHLDYQQEPQIPESRNFGPFEGNSGQVFTLDKEDFRSNPLQEQSQDLQTCYRDYGKMEYARATMILHNLSKPATSFLCTAFKTSKM